MNRRHLAAAVCLTTAFGLAGASIANAAPSGSDKVSLGNSLPTAAAKKELTWVAPARAAQPLSLTLTVSHRNQGLADQMLARGQVVSPAEYNRLFGADQAQLNKVAAWARSQGFTVSDVNRAAGTVAISGNVAKADKSMGVKMSSVRKHGRSGVAPTAAPSLPKSLGVTGVSGLDTTVAFKATPPKAKNFLAPTKNNPASATTPRKGATTTGLPTKAATSDGSTACSAYWGQHNYIATAGQVFTTQSNAPCAYRPQQINSMYGAGSIKSAAPTLGILLWGDDASAVANANKLNTKHGYPQLASSKYTKVVAPRRTGTQCDFSNAEQNLDIQSSHAIAPNASIRYYGGASCLFSDMASMLLKAVGEHKVTTLSMSFGNIDDRGVLPADRTVFDRALTQAALTGISVFAATGDFGTNADDNDGVWAVGYPASAPTLTAVGGTSVGLTQSGTRQFTAGWETAIWKQNNRTSKTGLANVSSQYQVSGAGGGNSRVYAKPSWQAGITPGTTRAVPDVSGLADSTTGMEIYTDGGFAQYGGTSLASPLIAALVGGSKANTKRVIGNAAPFFYKMAKAQPGTILDVNYAKRTGAFMGQDREDGKLVTYGFDGNPEGRLVTKAGWDNVTGIGEPTGAAFISGFGR